MTTHAIRIDKVGNILLLWKLLTAQPQTVAEIAKAAGVHRRTARTYLDSLEASRGARRVKYQGDPHVYWVRSAT